MHSINNSLDFANQVTRHFKENEYYNYVNKFGVGRIKDILANLEQSLSIVFQSVMLDRSLPLPQRLVIWNAVDEKIDPVLAKLHNEPLGVASRNTLLVETATQLAEVDIGHRAFRHWPAPRARR